MGELREVIQAIGQMISSLVGWMLYWIRRKTEALLALFGSALLVFLGWTFWHSWTAREIIVLGGPPAGDTMLLAERMAESIRKSPRPWFGRRQTVRVTPTKGFEENRRTIDADRDGTMIGLTHDGFGNSSRLGVLLDIEHLYLHVICRKEFLEQLGLISPARELANLSEESQFGQVQGSMSVNLQTTADARDASPVTLGSIAEALRERECPGRIYLGPRGSGTRELAEKVLHHYRLNGDGTLDAALAGGWDSVRAALVRGEVDLVFYSGPPDSGWVDTVASDRNCRLIGLDDAYKALAVALRAVRVAELPRHAYAFGDFCPQSVKTLVTRRVLVCSQDMTERDGYILAMAARDGLRDEVPGVIYANSAPPTATHVEPPVFAEHAALRLLRAGQSPSLWPGWIPSTLIVGLVIAIVFEALKATQFLVPHPPKGGLGDDGPAMPSGTSPLEAGNGKRRAESPGTALGETTARAAPGDASQSAMPPSMSPSPVLQEARTASGQEPNFPFEEQLANRLEACVKPASVNESLEKFAYEFEGQWSPAQRSLVNLLRTMLARSAEFPAEGQGKVPRGKQKKTPK